MTAILNGSGAFYVTLAGIGLFFAIIFGFGFMAGRSSRRER